MYFQIWTFFSNWFLAKIYLLPGFLTKKAEKSHIQSLNMFKKMLRPDFWIFPFLKFYGTRKKNSDANFRKSDAKWLKRFFQKSGSSVFFKCPKTYIFVYFHDSNSKTEGGDRFLRRFIFQERQFSTYIYIELCRK